MQLHPTSRAVAPPTGESLAARVLRIAQSQLGVAEDPGRPDRGAQVDAYRASATSTDGNWKQAWCAAFVSWTFNQAGAPLVDRDGDQWSAVIGDWAKAAGRFRAPDTTPAPGDVVLMHNPWAADRWANHAGIVERVLPDGRLQTIEGNVRDPILGRDSVMRVERTRERVVGFVATAGLGPAGLDQARAGQAAAAATMR